MSELHHTFCRLCEALCGLTVTVDGNRVVEIRPDTEHVVSRGHACAKGVRFGEIHHSPDRLRYPLERSGDRFQRISWGRALEEIGRKLRSLQRESGPDSIATYMGSGAGLSFLQPFFVDGFLRGIGSRASYQVASLDCSNKFVVAEHMYGSPLLQPFPDVDHTECLILIGANPAVSGMPFVNLPRPLTRLKAIEKRGGRVFFVNPRLTETARAVGEQVYIRPDTDIFFLLSFLNELVTSGGVGRERVARFMTGYDVLVRLARPFTAERTAEVTRIRVDKLREMVEVYRRASGAALYSATGVSQGTNGSLAFWIQEAINAISGNLDRRGGTLVGRGLRLFPRLARRAGFAARKDRSRVGNFASVVDSFPSGTLADEILTPGRRQVRGLVVVGGNPLLSCPNTARLEAALRELELLVVIDIFRNETANLAHYVLPGLSYLQRPDLPFLFPSVLRLQAVPYIQYTDRVVAPECEQRDECQILLDLTRAAGVPIFGLGPVQRMFELGRSRRRLGIRPERLFDLVAFGLGMGGVRSLHRYPHGRLLAPNRGGSFLGRRVLTNGGKVDLAPAHLLAAAGKLEADFGLELQRRERFKLIGKREHRSLNSWMHNTEFFAKGRRRTNYLHMNAQDAKRLGVEDSDVVRVSSVTGSVCVPVVTTNDLMRGVVALTHGWGHEKAEGLGIASRTTGVNANLLTADGPENIERLSGMAHQTGIIVEVRRAERKA
jgi:anaerobic selenocysteine-containing dehydrogenase